MHLLFTRQVHALGVYELLYRRGSVCGEETPLTTSVRPEGLTLYVHVAMILGCFFPILDSEERMSTIMA